MSTKATKLNPALRIASQALPSAMELAKVAQKRGWWSSRSTRACLGGPQEQTPDRLGALDEAIIDRRDHDGRHRQGFDLQPTRYDERGWRATFYTTGMQHSPTSARTGWEPRHATSGRRWAALTMKTEPSGGHAE